MYDRIDEWVVSVLTEFEGKQLQSVTKGDLDLTKLGGGAARQEPSLDAGDEKPFLERIQAALKDRASAVRTTERLTDSPACLVSDEHGPSANLERILRAAGQQLPESKPVLEINPNHPIVKRLKKETDETRFADWSHILFDQATLAEGGQLENPAVFVKKLNELMLTLAGDGPVADLGPWGVRAIAQMPNAQCAMPNAQCPMRNAQCARSIRAVPGVPRGSTFRHMTLEIRHLDEAMSAQRGGGYPRTRTVSAIDDDWILRRLRQVRDTLRHQPERDVNRPRHVTA